MVSKRKKKFSTGEGSLYMTRHAALKKLQLSLNAFRRLCIVKGIYPREPKSRKRAQKGTTGIKILYAKKDIQFLMHEPLIWKLREERIVHRKLATARTTRDRETYDRLLKSRPEFKLDHVVKERYPTFIHGLRDLDDCLTLCFLYSTFPSFKNIPNEYTSLCRRLTMEFLHVVIEAKALRKVFVSIKGYYYQAELKGQNITWIVPHYFSYQPSVTKDVDFRLMISFVDIYMSLLGFVNFRLYHSLNLIYPPTFRGIESQNDDEKALVDNEAYISERVASLNFPISRISGDVQEEEVEIDTFDDNTDDDPQKLAEKKLEAEKIKNLKTLFKGLKFFLNREVPREALVFIIRSFGGQVSWDKNMYLGATFDETDESITHQIVDRPKMEKQYISRYYVQPQWVFDSVNARELLPVQKYFIGAILPPHLSPFVDANRDNDYVPLEEQMLQDPTLVQLYNEEKSEKAAENKSDNEDDDKGEDNAGKNVDDEADDKKSSDESSDEDEEDYEKVLEKRKEMEKMTVTPGKLHVEKSKKAQERQEHFLLEKMIKKKHRKIYKGMMEGREKKSKEVWLLKKKRRLHEERLRERQNQTSREQKSPKHNTFQQQKNRNPNKKHQNNIGAKQHKKQQQRFKN